MYVMKKGVRESASNKNQHRREGKQGNNRKA